MRIYLSILLVLMVFMSAAGASLYPLNKDVTSYVKTDVGGANNIEGAISIQTIPVAETSDDDQIVNGASLNSSTALALDPTRSQYLDQPDVPRCILVTPSGTVTTTIKLTGTDISGAAISEWANFSASSTAVTTAKAFKTVDMINATTTVGTVTVKIGTSDKLGLNSKLATNTVLLAALNDTKEATAPTVTVSSTSLATNTIDTNTAPGGKVTAVWFIV